MHSSLLLASLWAAAAVAGPIRPREYVTESMLFVVTTTVTEDPTPNPTAAPDNNDQVAHNGGWGQQGGSWGGWPHGGQPQPQPQPTAPATTTAVATTAAPQPTQTSSSSGSSGGSSGGSSSGSTGSNSYQQTVLQQHNLHRANHSASALTWDDDLAATAQTIAATCVYAHSMNVNGGGYGQNIGAGTSADEVGSMITNEMYNGEINFYPQPFGNNNPDMSNFEKWGHFSQIVWKNTVSVGCATVSCASLQNVGGNVPPVFTVCNYKPPGNYQGQYSNVGSPLGQAPITD